MVISDSQVAVACLASNLRNWIDQDAERLIINPLESWKSSVDKRPQEPINCYYACGDR